MDFDLTPGQAAMKKELAAFCAEVIAPAAQKTDNEKCFPVENWKKLAERGYFGLMIPAEYGGQGGDLIDGLVAGIELASACASTAMAAGVSQWCAAKAIEIYGTDIIKDKYLRGMADGSIIGSFAVTEDSCGSDTDAICTTAALDNGACVLNGAKSYVTNAPAADLIVVVAKSKGDGKKGISVLLVPADSEGVSIGAPFETMGLRGSVASAVEFRDCRVGADHILGEPGGGQAVLDDIMDYSRLNVSAIALGIARAAFMQAKEFAEKRKAFGKPIGVFQDVAFRIADMHVEMDLASQLVFHGAWRKQCGESCSSMIAGAKFQAAEIAVKNADRAMTTLAGRGNLGGSVAERLYRDAKPTETAGGTGDMMIGLVASDLLRT